jgi:transcription elongation factor Elf1
MSDYAVMDCEDCDSVVTVTLEAYGNGQMMKIDCPNCGLSYDTNLDPTDYEEASK